MQSAKQILNKFNLDNRDKYLSQEWQSYGVHLADQLGDQSHKALYIKLAKETPRGLIDQALSFVLDSNARSKARLFMWKLKQLKSQPKKA